jgi:hypothetical protein
LCSSEPGAKAGAKVRPLGSSWFPVPFACGDGHLMAMAAMFEEHSKFTLLEFLGNQQ